MAFETGNTKGHPEQIMNFLVYHSKLFGEKHDEATALKSQITQEEISHFTGAPLETVTSILDELKNRKLIDFSAEFVLIHDIRGLERLAGH